MVSFDDVKKKFEKHNCILLMSEEEFNEKPRIIKENYNYTASCGHNHIINFSEFKRKRKQSFLCPICSYKQMAINNIKFKFNDIKTEFEKHKCSLLMTEEEFNKTPRLADEKYEYTASCGHNHIINFTNFKRQTHKTCPNCSYIQIGINNIKWNFNDVKTEFEKQNCVLLMSEEEFNTTPRLADEKYTYTARCGHNSEVRYDHFKNQSGFCQTCSHIQKSINQIKGIYIDVKTEFEKHNCVLLMSEEEFNTTPRIAHERYEYTASCGHNHIIRYDHFKDSQGLNCPNCSYIKQSIDNIKKYKLNPILPGDLEFNNIEYLNTIIGDSFDVKFNGECCLADCCIKPKNITEDSWLMIQMKSTEKPTSKGYKFHSSSKYINCIIMCICESDKKMWIFDGNKTTTKGITIGLKNSKYDEFEITTKIILHETLTHYYNIFPKYDFETIDTPITPHHKLEREYRIIRETMIHCLPFIRNERQGLVYDFIVNGFKVQEKIKTQNKTGNYTHFTLDKSNGKKKSISYQQGDNDFYWLNVNNKKHFYIIPEHELLTRNIINTDTQSSICLIPDAKNNKHNWANEYLFDYTKLDEEKLKKMFHL